MRKELLFTANFSFLYSLLKNVLYLNKYKPFNKARLID